MLCSVSSIGICLWLFKDDLRLTSLSSSSSKHKPQPERYAVLKEDISIRKERLAKRYQAATTERARKAILSESRDLLESILPDMMRCWLGTPWDFNGLTEQPGDGKIACGYFVSTVMRDSGFKLHRIKLAQQPSQTILNAFVPRREMHIRGGMDYTAFCAMVSSQPKGIYIVGLDKHVGFIVHDGTQLRFIHSSGSAPWCVVDESQEHAGALQRSSYRVIGNVTAQHATLKKWLTSEQVYP